jgi:hypothetical protein
MSNHYLTNDLTSRCYLSIRLFNRTLLNRTRLLILLLTEKQRVLVKAKVDNNNYYNVAVATHDINLNMVNIEKVRRK